ncbi:MAG: Dienelactone hydrolase family protein [Gemmatimonadetes bacterium]|nr:Dienelactone hydrolase family protein [Gemmatimonadota bacterium]
MTTPKKQIFQHVRGEAAVRGGRRVSLEFHAGDADAAIPATLLLPDRRDPGPGVLLLHGYSSRKEHLADTLGPALLAHGIASLAVDLPLHGTRQDPVQAQAARHPLTMFSLWRQAREETALAARFLRARAEVRADCTAVLGYSLGSYLAVQLAADDPAIRAVVLAAGGDLPRGTPLAAVARGVADPVRAVRKLAGRPLLMVHGRQDRTVRPDQAERLFAAAGEPKEIRWYDAGHILPPGSSDWVAAWLRKALVRDEARSA